jgi:hypothetical protein
LSAIARIGGAAAGGRMGDLGEGERSSSGARWLGVWLVAS